MSEWQQWVGRSEVREDEITSAGLTRWLSAFDREATADGSVPQGFHWCLGLPDAPTADLAVDGHPRREAGDSSFMPPVPQPRRMWAGSQIRFRAPLYAGEVVSRSSRIARISEKTGASGRLTFVEVEHETRVGDEPRISEIQSIVYRDEAAADAPLSPPQPGETAFDLLAWDAHRCVLPSEALLFRYSALTFNSHRIHYDLRYAIEAERYRGLVVHGPLTATLMLDLVRRRFGDNRLSSFSYRGLSPALCGEALHLVLRGDSNAIEAGAFAADGRQVMAASGCL